MPPITRDVKLPAPDLNSTNARRRSPLRWQVMGGIIAVLLYVVISAFSFVVFTKRPEAWQGVLSESILPRDQTIRDTVTFVDRRLPELQIAATSAEFEVQGDQLRTAILDRVVFRGTAAAWRDAPCRVEWLEADSEGPGYVLKKLRFEALPNLWIPALLYEPEGMTKRVPVVLNFNGHEPLGKAADFTQLRCINLAKRGMIALNVEWFGMGQLSQPGFRHGRINQLDLCGASGVAPFYLAMKRGLDLLLDLPHADPERVAVTGLSGGGWQAIMLSALDTRVSLANPVAGYSGFRTRLHNWPDLGDSEQTPTNFATVADYTHLTALLAPRPMLLTYNDKDPRYQPRPTLPPLLEAARPAYGLFGKSDFLQTHVNFVPGTHNYEQDNREAFYRMLAAHFWRLGDHWNIEEIDSVDEVKTAAELDVDMPEQNVDFNSLALNLYQSLPSQVSAPRDSATYDQWQHDQRDVLRKLVAYRPGSCQATLVREQKGKGWQGRAWRFQVGDEWQVPVVDLQPDQYLRTAIVIADDGRSSQVKVIKELLRLKYRVLAVDPFYFGECRIINHGYLFSLMVNTVGERLLGIQSSQIAALASWAKSTGEPSVELMTFGPRTSCIGVIATAVEPELFSGLKLHDDYPSLNVVLTENMTFETSPELFCPDLMVTHDLPVIRQLIPSGVLR